MNEANNCCLIVRNNNRAPPEARIVTRNLWVVPFRLQAVLRHMQDVRNKYCFWLPRSNQIKWVQDNLRPVVRGSSVFASITYDFGFTHQALISPSEGKLASGIRQTILIQKVYHLPYTLPVYFLSLCNSSPH